MIRLLIYNWIPFDETGLKGGGVTVYTRNLIGCLCKNPEYEVSFLSSGRAYNRSRADVYIEETENVYGASCRSYQVVNSPVLSPAALSFPYTQNYLYDYELKNVIRVFLNEHLFDVIHFQNLEGLSLGVFELKEEFPDIRFIYSVHNYYPICPQVMLWENDEKNCGHEDCGAHCLSCMKTDVFDRKVRVNQEISYDESRGLAIGDDRKKEQSDLAEFYRDKNFLDMQSEKSMQQLIRVLSEFRKANIEYINRYFDKVLAVSGRVAEIVINAGIRKNIVQVSYIGTKVAEHQCGGPKREYNGGPIHLCYLGFMRKMKGFYFLLEAMENMPEDMAQKVSFTFATAITDESVRDRLKALESKFESIHIIGGYSHEELPEILKEVDLGVVPPLWEDNLPQVAMEFKAYGVPVLCSDLGGAAELAGDKAFVFQAGDTADFICKLRGLMEHPDRMASYWNGTDRLVTLEEHMRDMEGIYHGKTK